MDKALAGAYLRGLYDGEGSATFRLASWRGGPVRPQLRVVSMTNTDPAIIEVTKTALDVLGIEYHIHQRILPSGKTAYIVGVYARRNHLLFRRYVDFTNPAKHATLMAMIRSYKRYGERRGDKWVKLYPKIRELRRSGLLYREIAERMAMPIESINHALGPLVKELQDEITERACAQENCGKSFVPIPLYAKQRYCSEKCGRLQYQRERRRAIPRTPKTCVRVGCTNEFIAHGPQIYCSHTCSTIARRKPKL